MLSKTRYIVFLMIVFLASSVSYGFQISKTKVIFKQGQDTWVKVKKGNKKIVPFNHPVEVSPAQMEQILRSMRFLRSGAFSVGKKNLKEFDLLLTKKF